MLEQPVTTSASKDAKAVLMGQTRQSKRLEREGRPGRLPPENSAIITRRITALALTLGIIMAAGKFWLFLLTGSVGVLSSLVHSALDIVAAGSSFIAVRFASRAPNAQYRFGFGKAESFSAVFQVSLICLAAFHLFSIAGEAFLGAGGLGHDHASHLPHAGHDEIAGHNHAGHSHAIDGSVTAIVVMSLFVCLTICLMVAQSWAIRATGSLAVRGDRAHYFADLLGNLFVISGLLIATLTDAYWVDALVGMVMALWLLYTAFRVAAQAWAQLMDRELTSEERQIIIDRVMEDTRIQGVTNVRTRASGPHLHMQMRLDLDPDLSLQDSHDIVVDAEARLMSAFPAADILIHPHPAGCAHAHGNVRFQTG